MTLMILPLGSSQITTLTSLMMKRPSCLFRHSDMDPGDIEVGAPGDSKQRSRTFSEFGAVGTLYLHQNSGILAIDFRFCSTCRNQLKPV